MQEILIGIALRILKSWLNEAVAARFIIEALRWWSDGTENAYDDRVVDAMAAALGVDSKSLKALAKEPK